MPNQRSPIVVGLGFGDEGKGSIVDAIGHSRRALGVVRFNGGPQAAHHVITPSGHMHCFSQFGSATLSSGAETFLGPEVAFDPAALAREAEALAKLGLSGALSRVHVNASAVVVTPFHGLMNRLQELSRGDARHGSCGRGIGQALLDSRKTAIPSLRAGELRDPASLRKKLRFLQLVKIDQAEQLIDASTAQGVLLPESNRAQMLAALDTMRERSLVEELAGSYARVLAALGGIDEGERLDRLLRAHPDRVVFEGAQGVLLDQDGGFFPHVTPSTTTFRGADSIAMRAGTETQRVGVLRAYCTRHGAGPMVSFDPVMSELLPEEHNVPNAWQGPMRSGPLDLVALRYAIALAGGVDTLAITCLDRLAGAREVGLCDAYELVGSPEPSLDALFVLERSAGRTLTRTIRMTTPPSLERQRELTEALARFRPIVQPMAGWAAFSPGEMPPAAAAFVREIGAALAPEATLLCSAGPSYQDKAWLSECGHARPLD